MELRLKCWEKQSQAKPSQPSAHFLPSALRGREKAIHQQAAKARVRTRVVRKNTGTPTRIISVFIQTLNLLMQRTPIPESKIVVNENTYEKKTTSPTVEAEPVPY